MNITKQLSESLFAACKAAGIYNPRYIAQNANGKVIHHDNQPSRKGWDSIWGGGGIPKRLNHPPYADDWQDSLLEWVDHIADTSKMIDRYTVEPHGKGYAVYLGRDNQHHGANLAHLSECSPAFADQIKALLNGKYTPQSNEASADDACKIAYHAHLEKGDGLCWSRADCYRAGWQDALAWKGVSDD